MGGAEYSALLFWLPAITVTHCSLQSMKSTSPSGTEARDAAGQTHIPPCVARRIVSSANQGQLVLQCIPPRAAGDAHLLYTERLRCMLGIYPAQTYLR